MAKKPTSKLTVETLKHDDATRKNIPTALHPGKSSPQSADRRSETFSSLARKRERSRGGEQFDFFAVFNGLPDDNAKTEFYQHDARWANRMILGDSQQVMASLSEREGMRGNHLWKLTGLPLASTTSPSSKPKMARNTAPGFTAWRSSSPSANLPKRRRPHPHRRDARGKNPVAEPEAADRVRPRVRSASTSIIASRVGNWRRIQLFGFSEQFNLACLKLTLPMPAFNKPPTILSFSRY